MIFSGYAQLQALTWDDYDLYGLQITKADGTIIYNRTLDKTQTGINSSKLWQSELNTKLTITNNEYLYFTFYEFSDFDNIGDNDHVVRLRADNGYFNSITDKNSSGRCKNTR